MGAGRSTQQFVEVIYLEPQVITLSPDVLTGALSVVDPSISLPGVTLSPEVLTGSFSVVDPLVINTIARVTQQFVEVIAQDAFYPRVTDTISFTDTLDRSDKTGDFILLTQSVALDLISNVSASSTISFSDAASQVSTQDYLVSQTLSFVEILSVTRILPVKTASSSISFSDAADVTRPVSSILALTHNATGAVFFLEGAASNTLTLSDQAVTEKIANLSASNQIFFVQSLVVNADRTLTVSDQLLLQQGVIQTFVKDFVLLQAPYESLATTIVLPRPLFQDGENLVDQLDIKFAEDGTLYTYVRRITERRLDYTFRLTREKSIELENFIDAYNSDRMRLCNWKGEIWKVKLVTNPVQFVAVAKGTPRAPTVDVSLTFEGERIN